MVKLKKRNSFDNWHVKSNIYSKPFKKHTLKEVRETSDVLANLAWIKLAQQRTVSYNKPVKLDFTVSGFSGLH